MLLTVGILLLSRILSENGDAPVGCRGFSCFGAG